MKKQIALFLLAIIFCLPLSLIYADTVTTVSKAQASKTQDNNLSEQTMDAESMGRSVNLRIFVPGLFVGYLGGVWDIGISPVMSFGPIVRVFVLGDYEGYDFGLNANYSLSGNLFQSGFVLNPYVEYYHGNYDQPENQFSNRPKVSTIVLGLTLMYQWMFHNGFNIMAGLGLEYSNEKIPVTMIGNSDFHGHFEVTIGYAF